MRTPSATLAAAQIAASRVPYLRLVFNMPDGITYYDLSTGSLEFGDRIIGIDHYEEAYDDYAIITLRDFDRESNPIPDLRGAWVEVGYGDVTSLGYGETNEAITSRLFVMSQTYIYAGGKAVVLLELEGMWALLSRTLALIGSYVDYLPAHVYTSDDMGSGLTIYDILYYVIHVIGSNIWYLDALDPAEDDGIIDNPAITPLVEIGNIVSRFEDCKSLVYRLITMTKCCLRTKTYKHFEVVYPEESDSAVLTFYSTSAPAYFLFEDRQSYQLPNHVVVFYNSPGSDEWLDPKYKESIDQDSVDAYGDYFHLVLEPEIVDDVEAQSRADVILYRIGFENDTGRLVAMHDCRLELYDKVAIDTD